MVISCTIVCLLSISCHNLISIGKMIFLFCSLLHLQCPEEYLVPIRNSKRFFWMTEITCSHFSPYTSWSTFLRLTNVIRINIQNHQISTLDVKKYFNILAFFICILVFSPFSFAGDISVSGQAQPFTERQKMIVIKEGKLWIQNWGKLPSISFAFLIYTFVSWYCLSCNIIMKTRWNDICKLFQLTLTISFVLCYWSAYDRNQ